MASSIIDSKMVWLLMFSAFSTAFGFVINDLSDAELDRSAGVLRNPFSTGELSNGKGIILAVFLLLVSTMALSSLNLKNQLLGLIVIFLYFTYSWIVRAKARPILDVAYHGFSLAILATIGYAEYRSSNIVYLLLALLVFFLSAVSQILQEVRDYETDRRVVRTTAILLGKKKSLILCLAFFTSAIMITIILLFYGTIPFEILLLSPLAYFIMVPIIQAIRNVEHESMLRKIRERRLIMIAALIVTLILARK